LPFTQAPEQSASVVHVFTSQKPAELQTELTAHVPSPAVQVF
jgi:hypothetical protein